MTDSAIDRPGAALVTGAGQRIGRAIALDLAAHGWAVAVHYRQSAAEAEQVVAEIAARGGRAAAVRADLCREEEVQALVPDAVRRLGRLSLLVNNASVFEDDDALGATRADWDLHMEANLRAPFVLTQAFAHQALEAGGAVVNILDQRVLNLSPHYFTYTLSKAGLWTLTRTLAMALAPRIRVNGIGPGPTLRNTRQSAAEFEEQWQSVPLQRPVDPSEIAAAVRFLATAPSVTGQMLALDAGEHLGWAQPAPGQKPTG